MAELDVLEIRRFVGAPLHHDILDWLGREPPRQQLLLDFSGVRASNASVTEELGPLLMQAVQQSSRLEHRYPVYGLFNKELVYNFASAFAGANQAAVALVEMPPERHPFMFSVQEQGGVAYVVIGQLSGQMERILMLADSRFCAGQSVTSDDLAELDFLKIVGPAARSKRLTELYQRRILAFEENPRNSKERLFTPVWRLPTNEHSGHH